MSKVTIKSKLTNQTLFEGYYKSEKDCLEDAVKQGIPLNNAALENLNLTYANLDNGSFKGASFKGTNLTGANISESTLRGCNFDHANLADCCLCFSNMQDCSFSNTHFGATDISGSRIDGSYFDTESCLSLNFKHSKSMKNCHYKNIDETLCLFSTPPMEIKGLDYPIIFFDNAIKIGHVIISYSDLLSGHKLTTGLTNQDGLDRLQVFYHHHRHIMISCCASRMGERSQNHLFLKHERKRWLRH